MAAAKKGKPEEPRRTLADTWTEAENRLKAMVLDGQIEALEDALDACEALATRLRGEGREETASGVDEATSELAKRIELAATAREQLPVR